MSTVDTARDVDLLRRAVGDRWMNHLGASPGAFLGATHANLSPDRVRAMVLDGAINPTAWVGPQLKANGGRFLPTHLRQRSDQGAAKTLRAFLDLCGRAGVAHCPSRRAALRQPGRSSPRRWRGCPDSPSRGRSATPSWCPRRSLRSTAHRAAAGGRRAPKRVDDGSGKPGHRQPIAADVQRSGAQPAAGGAGERQVRRVRTAGGDPLLGEPQPSPGRNGPGVR